MSCGELRRALEGGELPDLVAARLRRHALECDECAGLARRLEEADSALRALPVPPLSEALVGRIVDGTRPSARPRRRSPVWALAVFGAPVAAMVVAVLLLPMRSLQRLQPPPVSSPSVWEWSSAGPQMGPRGESDELGVAEETGHWWHAIDVVDGTGTRAKPTDEHEVDNARRGPEKKGRPATASHYFNYKYEDDGRLETSGSDRNQAKVDRGLVVTTTPVDARVTVDGVTAGLDSGERTKLEAGRYSLVLGLPGYRATPEATEVDLLTKRPEVPALGAGAETTSPFSAADPSPLAAPSRPPGRAGGERRDTSLEVTLMPRAEDGRVGDFQSRDALATFGEDLLRRRPALPPPAEAEPPPPSSGHGAVVGDALVEGKGRSKGKDRGGQTWELEPPVDGTGDGDGEELEEREKAEDQKRSVRPIAGKARAAGTIGNGPTSATDLATVCTWDDERAAALDLPTLPASGLFRSTYLPGDPELRWLQGQLERLLPAGADSPRPERLAQAFRAGLDVPGTAGLAMHLATDRAAVEGPSRLRLQIGLRGSARHARQRAPLDVALVVDLRQVPDEPTRRSLWTLADSLTGAQRPGDRVWLVVAGSGDPVRLRPGHVDSASVRRTLAAALPDASAPVPAGALVAALAAARKELLDAGAEQRPLGGSLVLLAAAGPVGPNLEEITAQTHAAAVRGVALSTLAVGPAAPGAPLAKLAAAGQGRRRRIDAPERAREVLDGELAAWGAVVARALRLQVRLAPGVRLVEVLGSEPLSAPDSEAARAVERSVDQRVAQTVGIVADRHDDEDGLQILFPTFYAGDEHLIVLDLLVPGPGAVADVRLRYKDMVKLDNATLRAAAALRAGPDRGGPASWVVQRAVATYRVADRLRRASAALAAGELQQARLGLTAAREELVGLAVAPGEGARGAWADGQVAMLDEYLRALSGAPSTPNVRQGLQRSLRYAELRLRGSSRPR